MTVKEKVHKFIAGMPAEVTLANIQSTTAIYNRTSTSLI